MSKLTELTAYLKEIAGGGLCVAFSGGVDSAVILQAGRTQTDRIHAVTVATPLHQKAESSEAAELARRIGCEHTVLRIGEIPVEVAANTPERCYLCKKDIFRRVWEYAEAHRLAAVLDGTNADDLGEYRPGLRALRELAVKSPLAELGITKTEVREIAAELGLSVAKKPSTPCLATRFPYGEALTPERLLLAGEIEIYLQELGFPIVRARIHGNILRLEVPVERIAEVLPRASAITAFCRGKGLDYVTLDLEGFRSGSMDIKIDN